MGQKPRSAGGGSANRRRSPTRRSRPAADRRRLDPRRRALHRRAEALRLRGPRRALRLPVLRGGRGDRLLLRADPAPALAGLRARRPGGADRQRDSRRQQRPRPRDRPARRQAHAGGPARARADADPLRGHARRRLPVARRGRGWAVGVGPAAVADPAAGPLAGRGRARPDRWPGAQQGAGRDGDAPAALLPAALRGRPAVVRLAVRERRLALRAPLRAAWGTLTERILLEVDLDGGRGESAPLEPYDGVSLEACRAALVGYAEAIEPLGED